MTQWTPGDLHLKRREKKENASAWGKGRCTTRADTREEGFREMEGVVRWLLCYTHHIVHVQLTGGVYDDIK